MVRNFGELKKLAKNAKIRSSLKFLLIRIMNYEHKNYVALYLILYELRPTEALCEVWNWTIVSEENLTNLSIRADQQQILREKFM